MSRIATLIAVMSVLWGAVPADAAAVFLQRTSTLTSSGTQCPPLSCTTIGSITASVTDFAPFSDSISYQGDSSASQQSSLNATQIVVQNNVTAEPPFLGSADSYFSVQFSIADTENFNFTGVSTISYQGGRTQIELTGPNGLNIQQQFVEQSDPSLNKYSVSANGTLQAGTYDLVVDATANGPGDNYDDIYGAAQAELDLTPVPVPPAALLLLSGLAPLGFLHNVRIRFQRRRATEA